MPTLFLLGLVTQALFELLAPVSMPARERTEPRLENFWDHWLVQTEALITPEERRFFLDLDRDLERERFLAGFWRARGDQALEIFQRDVEDAENLRSLSPARTRAVLVAGAPSRIDAYEGCQDRIRPLEVWRYEGRPPAWGLGSGVPVADSEDEETSIIVFVQMASFDPRSFEVWSPGDVAALSFSLSSNDDLATFLDRSAASCLGAAGASRLRNDLEQALDFERLQQKVGWPKPQEGWLDELRRELEASGASHQKARLELSYPGAFGRHTIVHGRVLVEPSALRELAPGQLFDQVTITGDLYSGTRLIDSFEVSHHVAGAIPQSDIVELDFYRRLRPGSYRLRLRVADRNGLALLRDQRQIQAPALVEPAPAPAGLTGGYSRLTRSEVVTLDTFPSIEILPVRIKASDQAEVHAITTGGPIAAVELRFEGMTLSIDREPPYSFEVRLDRDEMEVEAIALDPENRPLATATRTLVRESRPFAVRLSLPEGHESRDSFAGSPRSSAIFEISVPRDEELVRLECYRQRRRIAELGPLELAMHSRDAQHREEGSANEDPELLRIPLCPLPTTSGARLDYLRAVATLGNGLSAEDVLFLGREAPDRLEVRLVELVLSVFDASGRPVPGLSREDFRVTEDGREQRLVRVDELANLPLNVAIAMDTSSSMGRQVRVAVESARRFFGNILTDQDLASLIAFNHDLQLRVQFTSDQDLLRDRASGLKAFGSTRLLDAIVYALFQFSGLENRRALIVLSDGADVESDYPFEQVLSAATRAGVAIYPISIASNRYLTEDERTRDQLALLAKTTGGTAFTVDTVEELDRVYRQIEEELRSQYLLVYRPDKERSSIDLGKVEVEVLRPGLSTRNVHGY